MYNLIVTDKSDCNLAVSKSSVTLTKTNLTETITVTRDSTGKITATSQDKSIATVSGTSSLSVGTTITGMLIIRITLNIVNVFAMYSVYFNTVHEKSP